MKTDKDLDGKRETRFCRERHEHRNGPDTIRDRKTQTIRNRQEDKGKKTQKTGRQNKSMTSTVLGKHVFVVLLITLQHGSCINYRF